jgi:hypothetical protein
MLEWTFLLWECFGVGMSIMGVPSIGVHHVNVPYFLLWA